MMWLFQSMTTHVNNLSTTSGKSIASAPTIIELMLLGFGLLLMYVPTYERLADQIWSQEGQGHGPVMLALTIWLVWQRVPLLRKTEPKPSAGLASVLFLLGILLYALGRSQDFPEFEAGSQFLIFSSLLLFYCGFAGLRVMWFPLLFLIVLVPLPGTVVQVLTAPLKSGVSYVAEFLLYEMGYPIGRSGVTLTIGPYRLLVADACAGLNSIFALEAIGIFYLSVLQYTNGLRNVLIALFVLPISFVSNVARVVVLVLVTYYFGDEAGQGFVHGFAGILLFMVATALTIALDGFIGLFVKPHN
jgi:exosortase B